MVAANNSKQVNKNANKITYDDERAHAHTCKIPFYIDLTIQHHCLKFGGKRNCSHTQRIQNKANQTKPNKDYQNNRQL